MPRSSKRKPPTHTKRKITTNEEGWSTVTSSRSGSQPQSGSHDNPSSQQQDPDLTPDLLRQKINAASSHWHATSARAELLSLLRANGFLAIEDDIAAKLGVLQLDDNDESTNQRSTGLAKRRRIDNAILLALGSLSSTSQEASRRSRFQLAAFLDIVHTLDQRSSTAHNISDEAEAKDGKNEETAGRIKLYIQEPFLTKLDKEVLTQTYGFTILDDPEALQHMNERSLVFVTYMEVGAETIYRRKVVNMKCPLYVTHNMGNILERGELQRPRLEDTERCARYQPEVLARMVQDASELVESAKAVRMGHDEHEFPGHEEWRALPPALHIRR